MDEMPALLCRLHVEREAEWRFAQSLVWRGEWGRIFKRAKLGGLHARALCCACRCMSQTAARAECSTNGVGNDVEKEGNVVARQKVELSPGRREASTCSRNEKRQLVEKVFKIVLPSSQRALLSHATPATPQCPVHEGTRRKKYRRCIYII